MHWSVFIHLTVWLLSVFVTTDRHWPNKHHLRVARWMENWKIYFLKDEWKLAPVAISSLVNNPIIWQPGFDLDATGHSWITSRPTKVTADPVEKSGTLQQPACPCGKSQTMSHIADSCPQSKVEGGSCSDCTQLLTLLPNGWRYTSRKMHLTTTATTDLAVFCLACCL